MPDAVVRDFSTTLFREIVSIFLALPYAWLAKARAISRPLPGQ